MEPMDTALKAGILEGYRERLRLLCTTEHVAQRCFDMATVNGFSEDEATVFVAVHALEAMKSTQKSLEDALMELPPDAFYVREEDGTRKLVRYIGPTIQEFRAERDAKAGRR
jgi:hypothetical protein